MGVDHRLQYYGGFKKMLDRAVAGIPGTADGDLARYVSRILETGEDPIQLLDHLSMEVRSDIKAGIDAMSEQEREEVRKKLEKALSGGEV